MAVLVERWRKRDPYLVDVEGLCGFISEMTANMQILEDFKKDASVLDWANNNIQRKKYACIHAVFTYPSKDDPARYSGLYSVSLMGMNYLQFLDLKEGRESKGGRFLCIEIMHEETLGYDPERPHVKGNFSLHSYYDADWNPIEKPRMMKAVEKHLSRVSRWYGSPTKMKTEPYPTPPLWEE